MMMMVVLVVVLLTQRPRRSFMVFSKSLDYIRHLPAHYEKDGNHYNDGCFVQTLFVVLFTRSSLLKIKITVKVVSVFADAIAYRAPSPSPTHTYVKPYTSI